MQAEENSSAKCQLSTSVRLFKDASLIRVHDMRAMAWVARMMAAMIHPHFIPHPQDPKAGNAGRPG